MFITTSYSYSYASKASKRCFLSDNLSCLSRRFCNGGLPFQTSIFSNIDLLASALINAINSCTSVSDFRAFHCRVFKSLSYNHGFVGDQLVSGYFRLGCEKEAEKLFDELPERDLVSWNSFMSGFSRRGDLNSCLNAFSRMRCENSVEPNEVTLLPVISACANVGALDVGKCIHGLARKLGLILEVKVVNALINFYGKAGFLDVTRQLLEEMPVQNSVSWNSVMAAHVRVGLAKEGMGLFVMMRRAGIMSDEATLVALLQTCEIIGLRKLAEAVHGHTVCCALNLNLTIETALLDLYSKLGNLSASCKVFREMVNPDTVAWTAMLAAYAVHGCGKRAIEHFELMVREGVMPDHVTFTHLLSACSHSGFVKEGRSYFNIMSELYGVDPRVDHYACMVDLFGRSGLLNDAYTLIKGMPMEPNSAVWGALIGACRIYGNVELGREAAEKLFVMDPSDSRNYIMLSNMYSASGQWRDASNIRVLMKERSVIGRPGCSFIEHANRIHRFVTGDQSHPQTEQIYNKLEELIVKIREAGFISKTEFVLHDVEEDGKKDFINKHSEKLAIAFGLLVTDAGMPLVITKNLRICGDCHGVAKLISRIEKRIIVIRDTKRFHHFANGVCSCGDYW